MRNETRQCSIGANRKGPMRIPTLLLLLLHALLEALHASPPGATIVAAAAKLLNGKYRESGTAQAKTPDGEALKQEARRFILPQLQPHEDDSYLIEFHSDNCDHCEQMEPVLQRLERDLNTKVRRINIFRRREFYGLLEVMGHDECGGLPFYYNRRTGQAVCGATSYANLKRWGVGAVNHLFQDAPEIREPESEIKSRKDVGAKQMLMEKMQQMTTKTSKSKRSAQKGGKSSAKKSEAQSTAVADNTAATPGSKAAGKAAGRGIVSGKTTSDRKLSPSERLAARRAQRAQQKLER